MGAIVGATYALNEAWYDDLVHLDLERLPGMRNGARSSPITRLRSIFDSGLAVGHLVLRWGTWAGAEPVIRALLADLTLGKELEEARLPYAAIATDLATQERYVLERGNAADAVYASAALAGVLPPHRAGDAVLVDGVYADSVPIDVARGMGADVVVAVDAGQRRAAAPPRNALEAFTRAMEIVHHQHAQMRFGEADLVLAPPFACRVDSLDFGHHRRCVAAGARSVIANRHALAELLEPSRPRARSAAAQPTTPAG